MQLVIGARDNIIKELCCNGFPALIHAKCLQQSQVLLYK